jgi:hypothetical protein
LRHEEFEVGVNSVVLPSEFDISLKMVDTFDRMCFGVGYHGPPVPETLVLANSFEYALDPLRVQAGDQVPYIWSLFTMQAVAQASLLAGSLSTHSALAHSRGHPPFTVNAAVPRVPGHGLRLREPPRPRELAPDRARRTLPGGRGQRGRRPPRGGLPQPIVHVTNGCSCRPYSDFDDTLQRTARWLTEAGGRRVLYLQADNQDRNRQHDQVRRRRAGRQSMRVPAAHVLHADQARP